NVNAVSVNGGAVTMLATGQNAPGPIAVDANNVYWGNDNGGCAGGGAVSQVPVGGGTTTGLATTVGGWPRGIAVDSAFVYWTDRRDGTVKKVPIGGGSVTLLYAGGAPENMVIDATYVYWTDYSNGTLMKVAKSGGAPVTLVSNQASAFGITV